MQKKYLFELLFRFLKEKNLFFKFKKIFNLYILERIIDIDGTNCNSVFYIINQHSSNSINYPNINKEFNRIIFLTCKKEILSFIVHNKLTTKINNGIANFSNENYNNLNGYIDYFFVMGYPPLKFFTYMFSWTETEEGLDYWDSINKLFVKKIINVF